jgi:DNA polymerase III delta prime subunit
MEKNIFDSLWVERYRPQSLKDLVLDPEIRSFFENAIKEGSIPHTLLCAPAGTGKTSLAKIIVKELDAVYRYINASDERGIDSVREKIVPFAQTKSIDGQLKIIILDEVDGFTPDAQRALRDDGRQ